MATKLGAEGSHISKAAEEASRKSNMTQDAFLAGVRRLAAANDKCKLANENRRNVRIDLKSEGFELGLLDEAIKMADWDRQEVREKFDLRRRYAAWLGLPVGTQAEMFEGKDDDEILTADWTAAGRTAALSGKPARPTKDCPPQYHEAFMAGFAEAADADFEAAAPADPIDPDAVAAAAKADAAARKPAPRARKARTNV